MRLQKKLLVVALACAFPLGSAFAQSAADLKKEIEALKAQLQLLQKTWRLLELLARQHRRSFGGAAQRRWDSERLLRQIADGKLYRPRAQHDARRTALRLGGRHSRMRQHARARKGVP